MKRLAECVHNRLLPFIVDNKHENYTTGISDMLLSSKRSIYLVAARRTTAGGPARANRIYGPPENMLDDINFRGLAVRGRSSGSSVASDDEMMLGYLVMPPSKSEKGSN